jgi:hypothetical protein
MQSLRIFRARQDIHFEFTNSGCFGEFGLIPNRAGPTCQPPFLDHRVQTVRQHLDNGHRRFRPRFPPPFSPSPTVLAAYKTSTWLRGDPPFASSTPMPPLSLYSRPTIALCSAPATSTPSRWQAAPKPRRTAYVHHLPVVDLAVFPSASSK